MSLHVEKQPNSSEFPNMAAPVRQRRGKVGTHRTLLPCVRLLHWRMRLNILDKMKSLCISHMLALKTGVEYNCSVLH